MLVTDAQIHLWELERPDRPWPKDGRSTPHLPDGFTAEQMLAEMDPVGVDRAVIVPPSWIGETNAYALELAAQYPTRFAVMGRFDSEDPAFMAQLPTWLDQPHMLGIRITFNTPHFVAGLDEGIFDPLFPAASITSIPLMALFSGPLLSKVPPVVEKYPGSAAHHRPHGRADRGSRGRKRSPHRPAARAGEVPERLRQDDERAEQLGGVVPVQATSSRSSPDIRRVWGAALMWGSDITRLKGTYEECLRLFRDELDFLSADDKEWILGKSLADALNWPETPR